MNMELARQPRIIHAKSCFPQFPAQNSIKPRCEDAKRKHRGSEDTFQIVSHFRFASRQDPNRGFSPSTSQISNACTDRYKQKQREPVFCRLKSSEVRFLFWFLRDSFPGRWRFNDPDSFSFNLIRCSTAFLEFLRVQLWNWTHFPPFPVLYDARISGPFLRT